MSLNVHQTSFASGEWAPKLQSRVDVQKYRTGAALMRNFFVDYSGGGASTRQGTKFIAQAAANGARLVGFQPSTTISYVLEFGQNYIRFYSNGAQIQSGGIPYQITTPYNIGDLFPNPLTGNPGIKFVQDVTSLIICHPNYQPQILTINAATSWTLSTINFGPAISPPTGVSVSTTESGGNYSYNYLVTAVDSNGQESLISNIGAINSIVAVELTPGQNVITWSGVNGAASYNVYKTLPVYQSSVPSGTAFGFIANVTGTTAIDAYPGITPDFSQTPPVFNNPFGGGSVISAFVTASGTYTTVPGVTIAPGPYGPPYQATANATLAIISTSLSSLIIHSPGGNTLVGVNMMMTTPGVVLEILAVTSLGSNNYQVTSIGVVNAGSFAGPGTPPATDTPMRFMPPGGPPPTNNYTYVSGDVGYTWGVAAVNITYGGYGYTGDPAVTFSTGAASATTEISVAGNPGVPSFFQERLVLAAQVQALQTYNMSQPGSFFNFNVSNPSEDDDGITGTIIGEELNDIRSLVPVPTGIIALTGKGAWLINGGGNFNTAGIVTPANQAAWPQAFNGANDLSPIKINLDLLFVTNKGNYVRDFTYNIYANVYTGSDISVLSNHLFFGYYLLDWAWSEEPFKTLWAIRNDGVLLSLGFVKEQDLIGWAHHDTNGQFLSTCSVIENVNGNVVDAVYFIVQRFINGSYVQYVERMVDRYFPYGYEDAWSVDCGLQTSPQASPVNPLTITGSAAAVGNSVTLTDTADAPFTSGMVGWVVRAGGGIYTITAYTSTSQVTATVTQVPSLINQYTGVPFPATGWTIWEPVSSVTGLTQLVGQSVVGVADGVAIGPLTVSGSGGVTLPNSASKVTLGLQFTPQLQTLPLDLGEPTVQGKRKRIVGVTAKVADTLGLSIGTTFANAVPMKDFLLGNVGTQSNTVVTGLVDGDGRTILDQDWQEAGNYCIEQTLPYPATVLGVVPEIIIGDDYK